MYTKDRLPGGLERKFGDLKMSCRRGPSGKQGRFESQILTCGHCEDIGGIKFIM